MKSELLVIQNDPEVPLGVFAPCLADEGVAVRTVRPYAGEMLPEAGEVPAVIVLGGAMGVYDTGKYPFLLTVKGFILECVAKGVPFLGVCLGGQLLADALGGEVLAPSPHGEKGTLTVALTPAGEGDPLFAGIDREFGAFQWHNDSFTVPDGAALLASSPVCPHQAFRFGANAYGLQFHPEVDRAIVDCWARWSEKTAPGADAYLAAYIAREEACRNTSRRLLANFLRIARLR